MYIHIELSCRISKLVYAAVQSECTGFVRNEVIIAHCFHNPKPDVTLCVTLEKIVRARAPHRSSAPVFFRVRLLSVCCAVCLHSDTRSLCLRRRAPRYGSHESAAASASALSQDTETRRRASGGGDGGGGFADARRANQKHGATSWRRVQDDL